MIADACYAFKVVAAEAKAVPTPPAAMGIVHKVAGAMCSPTMGHVALVINFINFQCGSYV